MEYDLPRNNFKRGLSGAAPQFGLWLTLASPTVTEIVAGSGLDWLLIDMEHTANEVPDVLHHLRAAETGAAEPIVRVPWNDPVVVKRILDQGARTVLFPFVQSADEARAAVRATRYPPNGIRGVQGLSRATRFGRVPDYFKHAVEEICVIVQVETRQALDAIEEIAMVDGVEALFVGPADLSADFGYAGVWGQDEVWEAIVDAGRRVRAAGKAAGTVSSREADCQTFLDAGFNFLGLGSDGGIIARECSALVKAFKGT